MNAKSIVFVLIASFMTLTLNGCGANDLDREWIMSSTFETFQKGNIGFSNKTQETRNAANRVCSWLKKSMDETGFIGGLFVAILAVFMWGFCSFMMLMTNAFCSFSIMGVIGTLWDSFWFVPKMFFAIFGFHF